MRQDIVHVETLQHLLHEQTSQLRQFNHQLQEEIRKRQLLEEKLQTSEAKIRAVFEAMTDIVLVLNTQGNQIKDIEIIPTSSNLLYESNTELIDKTVKEFFQDNIAKIWFQKVQEALDKKQTLNFDYSLSLKGREVWLSASISPISNTSVVWVARDISDRKQAEAEKTVLIRCLEQSERRLSQILGSVSESLIVQDKQNHQVLFANAAATALFNKPYEELIGESLGLPLISGELTEVDIIHPSGKLLVAQMRAVDIVWGNQSAYLITLRDVTECKRAEEELRRSEERWRLVLQGSQDGIWDRNLKTNEVFRSARWKEILGYEDHEIPNNYEEWVERIHPDDIDRVMQVRQDYLTRKIPSYALEYRLQCKDGSYKWFLMRAQAVWDESGSPVRMLGAVTDINERKIAEERLRLLERAIASSSNGIVISDAQAANNPVIYANSGFERITGYAREEVIGTNCRFLQGTDKVQPGLEQLRRAIASGQEARVVLRNYRKDGTLFWNEFCITPVRDETGRLTHFIGIQTDISDRKLAEERLKKSEASLAFAQRVAHVGNWEFDVLTQKIAWSKEMFYIHGLDPTRPEPTLAEHIEQIHPEDRALWQKIVGHALESGEAYKFDFRIVRSNGQVQHIEARGKAIVNEAGQVIQLFGTVMDITARKLAEEQLRWQEALMRSMTSVSPLAFFVVDNRTDTILYSNHRFCEIWGIEHLEERIQQGKLKNNDIIPDCLSSLADIPAFAQSCKPLQSEENRVVVEDEIPFADGRKIRRFSTQVRDRQDRYFGRLYIFEDITHRKIAEEALRQSEAREREKAQALERAYSELKRTQAQLIQAEKMSSLGQMVAGIAHEINNPTSFIYGNINPAMEYTQQLLHLVELYRQHYPEPVVEIAEQMELIEPDFIAEDFPKLLASMKEGAQRISQIVLSLRNFSRLDESERKRVEIHQGIDNTLLILKHRLKQQPKRPEIRVINEYGQLPKIECYPGQLNQVFMNIISNAIDALDEATEKDIGFEPTIRICTEVIKSDSRSSHSNDQSVSQVLIRIRDNSPSSIKAELLPKIFDPFFTTKPVGSGTGLGLSISYQIVVDRHRGQLSCYSTPGAGTEFAIELPIAQSVTSH